MNNYFHEMLGFAAIFSFLLASMSSPNITGNVVGVVKAEFTGLFFMVLALFLSFVYILIKKK